MTEVPVLTYSPNSNICPLKHYFCTDVTRNASIGKKLETASLADKAYKVGEILGLDVPEWRDFWSDIAEVVEHSGEKIKVIWYKGGITTQNRRWVISGRGKNQKYWIDEIDPENVILRNVQLTKGERLPQDTKDYLLAYKESKS